MLLNLGNIKIHIEKDFSTACELGANIIKEKLSKKPNSVIGFATGGTPIPMYKHLIEMCNHQEINFSEMVTFNLDEYFPISKENDQSYYYFMRENLFNHINVNFDNLHIPNGLASDVEKECADYENLIKTLGPIDLQILGMGLNGHIGFNEPDNKFTQGTNYVALQESTITANARFFNSIDDVPKKALTMGIKTIMMSTEILLLVNGEKKADILEQALFGEISPHVPASALQLHQNVTILADESAVANILKRF